MLATKVIQRYIDKGKFMNVYQLKTNLIGKRENFIEIIREKKENALETFTKVMWKLAIYKFVAVMVAFIVMMVFFFTHLNGFAPITSLFSKWVSSPFIGFFIFVMIIKFVAVSIGLTATILTVKNTTFKEVRLKFIEACKLRLQVFKLRLQVFLKRKVQPQASYVQPACLPVKFVRTGMNVGGGLQKTWF